MTISMIHVHYFKIFRWENRDDVMLEEVLCRQYTRKYKTYCNKILISIASDKGSYDLGVRFRL